MENRILEKANVAEQDYIRQGSQAILKMSSRNYFKYIKIDF